MKTFTLNETMEISKTKAPVRQIIRQKAVPVITEVKVITNKLLLKGEVLNSILYCADTKDGGYEIFENSLPISQIIELDGITENSDYSVRVSVSSLNIITKSNSTGEKKLFDVTVNVCAVIKADKNVDISLPSDCYSTLYNIKTEKKPVAFDKILLKNDDMIMVKKTEEFSNVSIGEIINIWCDDVVTTYSCVGNELKIIGSTNVSILAKDETGQPFYTERTVTFESTKNIDGGCKDIFCTADGVVSAVGYVLQDSNKIDLRSDPAAGGYVVEEDGREADGDHDHLRQNPLGQLFCEKQAVLFLPADAHAAGLHRIRGGA